MRVGSVGRHNQRRQLLSNCLVTGMAEQPLSRRVQIDDGARRLHHDDGVESRVEDRPRRLRIAPEAERARDRAEN